MHLVRRKLGQRHALENKKGTKYFVGKLEGRDLSRGLEGRFNCDVELYLQEIGRNYFRCNRGHSSLRYASYGIFITWFLYTEPIKSIQAVGRADLMIQFQPKWHYTIEKGYFEIRIGRDLDRTGRELFVLFFYHFPVGAEKLQTSVRMAVFRPRI